MEQIRAKEAEIAKIEQEIEGYEAEIEKIEKEIEKIEKTEESKRTEDDKKNLPKLEGKLETSQTTLIATLQILNNEQGQLARFQADLDVLKAQTRGSSAAAPGTGVVSEALLQSLAREVAQLKIERNSAVYSTTLCEFHNRVATDMSETILPFENLVHRIAAAKKCLTGLSWDSLQSFHKTRLESDIQTAMSENVKSWGLNIVDGHLYPTIKKPDLIRYLGDYNTLPYVLLVGDWKAPGKIDNKARGQLECYLMRIMQKQLFRPFMYGFLCDTQQWEVHRLRYENGFKYAMVHSAKFSATGDEGRLLSGLLTASPRELGMTSEMVFKMGGENIVLLEILGSGKFSVAFKGIFGTDECVVKIEKEKGSIEREKKTLDTLYAASVPNIPKFLGSGMTDDGNALVFNDIGSHFAMFGTSNGSKERMTENHVNAAIDTIRKAHAAKLCHCDFSPRNFYVINEETTQDFMLNDWGSAQTLGEQMDLTLGIAFECASNDVLDAILTKQPITWETKHDLHMLVRSVFILIVNSESLRDIVNGHDIKGLKSFWDRVSASEIWGNSFRLAEAANYDDVAKALGVIVRAFEDFLP